MTALTVKDLLNAMDKRPLAYVQVAREEEAITASEAGMNMIGTAFIPGRPHFAKAVPNSHFQFGMPWGKHADATEVLRDAMVAMQAGAHSVYCGMSPRSLRCWPATRMPNSKRGGMRTYASEADEVAFHKRFSNKSRKWRAVEDSNPRPRN